MQRHVVDKDGVVIGDGILLLKQPINRLLRFAESEYNFNISSNEIGSSFIDDTFQIQSLCFSWNQCEILKVFVTSYVL